MPRYVSGVAKVVELAMTDMAGEGWTRDRGDEEES